MIDIFYTGKKPNLFAFEKSAKDLEDAAHQSKTKLYWYIYGCNNYLNFDFDWRPAPWEEHHVHCFGTQWQRTGGAYLANKDTVQNKVLNFRTEQKVTRFIDKTKWIVPNNIDDSKFDYSWHPDELEPDYEYHFPTQWQRDGGPVYRGSAGIKYVSDQKIRRGATQIFYMDFLNEGSQNQFVKIQKKYPDAKQTRYVDNHINVFKRIANLATTEFVWIISSICDYTNFDFTWHPAPEQKSMMHVFPTTHTNFDQIQNQGDTFYVNVLSLKEQINKLEILDWFKVINYCKDQYTVRMAPPRLEYTGDSIVDAIKETTFNYPYAIFVNTDDKNIDNIETPCIWANKDKIIEPLTKSGSSSLIPKEVKNYLNFQIYDYPYINKKAKIYKKEKLMDVIFISNGEPMAETNWENLKKICPRAIRSQGITGRELAYKSAAQLSTTPWFFAVFAKTEVLPSFSFDYQPDYYQEPKHYIFHSRNPLNGLEYGAMNINLYNKKLVLETDPGIDFTLSKAHEVVPICASISRFNADPWITWRSAFREVLKLKKEVDKGAGVEIQYRLEVWRTHAVGENAEHCLQGAQDAIDFYTTVNGSMEKLKLSFDWQWCQEYYFTKYNTKLWLETI
jgi:hypothetical protein